MSKQARGPNGGVRPGAGRPHGARDRAVIEREKQVAAAVEAARRDGIMPLDVLLHRMRKIPLPQTGQLPDDDMVQMAVYAAPFLHSKLASSEVRLESQNVHVIISDRPMTTEEWCKEYGIGTDGVDTDGAAKDNGTAS